MINNDNLYKHKGFAIFTKFLGATANKGNRIKISCEFFKSEVYGSQTDSRIPVESENKSGSFYVWELVKHYCKQNNLEIKNYSWSSFDKGDQYIFIIQNVQGV